MGCSHRGEFFNENDKETIHAVVFTTVLLLQEYSGRQYLSPSSYILAVKEKEAHKTLAFVKCFYCSRCGHYPRNCKLSCPKSPTPHPSERNVHFERMDQSANGDEWR